jgi:DNA-directed RNA polymerase subunit RPC12/RpoP
MKLRKYTKSKKSYSTKTSFRCLNCHIIISNIAAGTKHRNHCPLCLWCKHVDLKTPGDRRSVCEGRMKPIGLTLKLRGELMIVHECLKCGRLSPNRIAGDDNTFSIVSLLNEPNQQKYIPLLTLKDREWTLAALFGYDHPDI